MYYNDCMKQHISGIYAITNKINGKKYIGHSKSVYYRWKQNHLPELKKGIHANRHLQSAWRKYGESSFHFDVLEECEESLLEIREGYWIEHFRSWEREFGYNLVRIIDGKQVLLDECRQQISEKRKIKDYWISGANKKILDLFAEGMSKSSIAIALKITRSAVYSCLQENGLHVNEGKGSEVKLTDETKLQIAKLREEGKSWDEIFDVVDISKTQVYRTGVAGDGTYKTSKVKRATYRTVTPDIIKQVEHLRAEGKTWEQIEMITGVSRFALHQHGITKQFEAVSKKKPKNKMTNETRETIIRLRAEGRSLKEVSQLTGVPQSTLRYNKL